MSQKQDYKTTDDKQEQSSIDRTRLMKTLYEDMKRAMQNRILMHQRVFDSFGNRWNERSHREMIELGET